MNELDKNIRAALAADEAELLRQFEEPSLSEQVIESFRGRRRGLMALTFVIGAGYAALMIVSVIQFFRAEELREMIAWACGFGLGVLSVGLTKIFYWMELNRNAVTREIKRLELQVARMSERLAKTP